VRRPLGHRHSFVSRRIPGSNESANVDLREAHRLQLLLDPGQRFLQILLNVVRESFERRDVNDLGGVFKPSFQPLSYKIVDSRQKRGKRFA